MDINTWCKDVSWAVCTWWPLQASSVLMPCWPAGGSLLGVCMSVHWHPSVSPLSRWPKTACGAAAPCPRCLRLGGVWGHRLSPWVLCTCWPSLPPCFLLFWPTVVEQSPLHPLASALVGWGVACSSSRLGLLLLVRLPHAQSVSPKNSLAIADCHGDKCVVITPALPPFS